MFCWFCAQVNFWLQKPIKALVWVVSQSVKIPPWRKLIIVTVITFSQFHNKLNKYNTIYGYCWNVFIQLISCIASCLYIIIGSWRLRVAVMLEIECTQTCLWSKYTVLQNKSSLEDSESFITFPWDLSIAFQNKNRAEEFTEWFLLINQKIFNMGKMNGDFPSFDLNTVKRNWKKLVTAKVAHKPFPLFSLLSFLSQLSLSVPFSTQSHSAALRMPGRYRVWRRSVLFTAKKNTPLRC